MSIYSSRVKYNRDDEKRAGLISLDHVLGEASPERGAYVLLSGPGLHNPEITLCHERVHNHLFAYTTVGNIQQLLSRAIGIRGIDPKLRDVLSNTAEVSVDSVRWLHEGCATYAQLKEAQVHKLTGWEMLRDNLPRYYLAALRSFEDAIEPIDIFEESKIVIAEAIAQFAMSPPIYEMFVNPESLYTTDLAVFTQCLERASRMFGLLADQRIRREFGDLHNTFVETKYTEIHGVSWTTDAHSRARTVKPENVERFALEEVLWLHQYFSSHLQDVQIVDPRHVPLISGLSAEWDGYFRKRGIETHGCLSFSAISMADIDSSVTVKAPALPYQMMREAPPAHALRHMLLKAGTKTFAQVYIHRETQPFVLNPALKRQVRCDEAYVRFGSATVFSEPLLLVWHDSAYYRILPSSDLQAYLQAIDCPNLHLCFWERDIPSVHATWGSVRLPFCNLVTGLVFPTGLDSMKALIQRWSQHTEGFVQVVSGANLGGNHFVVLSCDAIGLQLIAPVSRLVSVLTRDWVSEVQGTAKKWDHPLLVGRVTGIEGEVVLQGIAIFGF